MTPAEDFQRKVVDLDYDGVRAALAAGDQRGLDKGTQPASPYPILPIPSLYPISDGNSHRGHGRLMSVSTSASSTISIPLPKR
jgi:hypothetical protein